MKPALAILLFCICWLPINVQAQYFSVKKVKLDKQYSFPVFANSNSPGSAKKINQLLQISELEILSKHNKQDFFRKISTDNGTIYGGKVAISYQVESNNSKLLSVKFDQSSCGMTCHYWVKYYNFNAENGNLFQLQDLFTSEGLRILKKYIAQKRIKQLHKEVAKLERAEQGDFSEIADYYKDDDLNDFYINNNKLYIDGDNSFHKNLKFSGIETVCEFNLNEFKHHLNLFGKTIFKLNNASIKNFQSSSFPQLYNGKIANKDVIMVINTAYKDEMKAEYVYSQYGDGIFLHGMLKGTELNLVERNANSDSVAVIKAQFKNNRIIGIWTHSKTGQMHQILLNKS
jgi:hypothetical protein